MSGHEERLTADALDVPLLAPREAVPRRAKAYLCSSYFLAAWAWRSWEFIVALVLIEVYPQSLFMVSSYGLLDNLARVLLGPAVGAFVDRSERLPSCQAMLLLQNGCIGGSALAALALLWPGSPLAADPKTYWALLWAVSVLGATSSAGSTGVSIAVEREAVKALCGADSEALASLNSTMRAIDLTCLLLAPLVAGVLMTAAGPFAAVGLMAGYCLGAYLPEVGLLRAAFSAAPVLRLPKHRSARAAGEAARWAQGSREDVEAGDAGASAGRVGVGAHEERAEGEGEAEAEAQGGTAAAVQAPYAPPQPPLPAPTHASEERAQPAGGAAADTAGGQVGSHDIQEGSSVTAATGSQEGGADGVRAGGDGGCSAANGRRAGGREGCQGRPGGAAGAAPRTSAWRALLAHARAYGGPWATYVRQPVLLPSLALALLYCTVLSLGFLMTSFLKWTGLTQAEVAAYRGLGALSGLAATVMFPPLRARLGPTTIALLGITYQLACLAGGVLPVTLAAGGGMAPGGGGRPGVGSVRLLVGGVVASRAGLWLFDLAVTQLVQEGVPEDQMGAVYGVQSSLQAGCEMLSFVAGLAVPQPERFGELMLGSLGAVAAAVGLVGVYAVRQGCGAGERRVGAAGGK